MKKILALVLALVLALSLVACGGGKDDEITIAVSGSRPVTWSSCPHRKALWL